jgi:hypothetical protein
MEGNLIKIISDKGGGPKEYMDLGDVIINDEEIIVEDGQSLRRFYYTLDGEYIRHEKCLPCLAFDLLGDKFILHLGYHQSFDYKVTPNLVVSVNDSAIRRGLPYHKIQRDTTQGHFYHNYKGDLFFTPVVSDTVYQILTDSTFSAKYFVKQKKSVWKLYDKELVHGEISQRLKEEGYSELGHVFLETEKNIYFQLILQDDELASLVNRSYWYDKDSKQTYMLKIDRTPKTEIPYIIPQAIGIWENYYFGVITPEQIEGIREYQKKNKGTKNMVNIQNEELRNIINIKDDPNQVLVLYKIDF